MKLSALRLKNYRCFSHLQVDLHPQLTVVVAENGQGKTTILDAIRVGIAPFLNSFDLASSGYNDPANGISIDDVSIGYLEHPGAISSATTGVMPTMTRSLPAEIALTGNWGDGQGHTWVRFRESEREGTQTLNDASAKAMVAWAKQLQASIRTEQGNASSLPMLGYYGTGRLWSEKKLTKAKKAADGSNSNSFHIRTFAYRDCMDPASSYKHFKEWFTWISEAHLQAQVEQFEQQQEGTALAGTLSVSPEISNPLTVVRNAINAVLKEPTGWHNLKYSVAHQKNLVLEHPAHGVLKVDQLSDGIRTMLALVGDIAYRCVKLNPQLGTHAASHTSGVVLIDEVDMHLHPRWQQLVLTQLTKVFPQLQFIVTTHSPQVLSTIHKENIRMLGTDQAGEPIAQPPLASTYGEPSGTVLHNVMHVDPQPPVEEKADLQRLTALVDQGLYQREDALILMQKLTDALGSKHPQIQRLGRSIVRQEALKK